MGVCRWVKVVGEMSLFKERNRGSKQVIIDTGELIFVVLRSSFFVLRSYLKVDNVGPSSWKYVHNTEEAE